MSVDLTISVQYDAAAAAARTRRLLAYVELCGAASRMADARDAARGAAPGSAAAVAYAQALTDLADLRAAHTLATGAAPDDVAPDGLLTADAAVRLRTR